MQYKRPKKKNLLIELDEEQKEIFHRLKIKAMHEKKTMKGKILELVEVYLNGCDDEKHC